MTPAFCTRSLKYIIPMVINATFERENHAPLCLLMEALMHCKILA